MDISSYMRAGYPLLYVITQEADRATQALKAEGWQSYAWDCLRGITDTRQVVEDVLDPIQAMNWLAGKADTILKTQNMHHFLGSVEVIQALQNYLQIYKSQGTCLVMVGPQVDLPPEIEKYVTTLDFALPGTRDLEAIMKELGQSVAVEVNPEAVEAAKGLTEFEAETAFALSLVERQCFDPEIITAQ
ncbi:MAG: hypothetical protein U5L00_07310 [Desulfovermiculus sp.]|nr:hypothetical protein [Desulfovermiculus sp.]